MIHQFIFAAPKPGLSADAFTSYWINFHAVDYAAKIPQIRQYLVAERLHIDAGREVPSFEGVGEIWLKDDAEQLASLQTPEFLQGARADEPRWAAFWQTQVLDTDAHILTDYSGPAPWPEFTKLYILIKRRPDLEIEAFKAALIDERTQQQATLTDVERHIVGFARPGLYGLGEPRFDAIEVLSFRDVDALQSFLNSHRIDEFAAGASQLVDVRYLFTFVGREHWIIRQGER